MVQVLQPWQLFVAILAGWIDEHRQAAIEYLREENRVVTPDTILRRHRQLIVQKWTHQRRSMGRPQTVREIAELAVRMARENCPLG